MKYSIFIIAFLCFACANNKKKEDNPILGNESVTFMIQDLPLNHNYESDIYISGNFEGWSGGREQFKLNRKDSIYSIKIPKYRENISFKFTKGEWGTEECQTNGNPIENRTYTYSREDDSVIVKISNWADGQNQHKPSTALENVMVFSDDFEIPQLNRTRKISVYLPPDYETSNKSYPVLYMQDGQNLFDTSTSYSGEWEVDETLNKFFSETGFGLIVVAIDHGEGNRFNEYAPWDHVKYGKGEGKAYLDFLVNTLKPAIDNKFKTISDRDNTAIMGSSMGGLIAHYAIIQRPDIFGKAGIFSPAFWVAEPIFRLTKNYSGSNELKLYYLAGGQEGKELLDNVNNMAKCLDANETLNSNYKLKIVPSGIHSESFWKEEFGEAIKWLFDIKDKL